ncbi:general odorant-binding protein 19d-like [Calliphora vicina]|uniref:general odorant-binding protein 19d-like n=1 Tax=Calliphora vicina TaxID=7373 RepID=UPI00325C00FF
MKFLIVFAYLILAACSIRAELTKEEAIAIATGCKEEAGASDDDFEAMVSHQPAVSQEGKCMHACALKKFGVLSDEGKLVKDVALELSESLIKDEEKKALMADIVETCDQLEVSDDHCEAAEEYGQCWRNEFEAKGISPDEDLV